MNIKELRKEWRSSGKEKSRILDEATLDNDFELLGKLAKVHSSIKDIISDDYTLADLTENEKQYIRETVENAQFIMQGLLVYGQEGYRYVWDEDSRDWLKNSDGSFKKIPLEKKEKEKIGKLGLELFENFMIEPHMMAILGRNKSTNFLVKLLGKSAIEEGEALRAEQENKSMIQKLKDKFSGDDEE